MKLVALLLLATAACTEEVYVKVNCLTTDKGADYTVDQVQGKTEVETCWDFAVTCGNGVVVTAERTCQKIGDGKKVVSFIPNDKMHDRDKCGAGAGKPPVASITNITINGKSE